jgi:hypothetical protein
MRSVSAKALCFWGDVSLVNFHWRPLLYISFYIVLIGAEINAARAADGQGYDRR